jgi:transformation/transcription domain-associated protein
MNGPTELWMMRKQFASQMAAINFMTYIFCIAGRNPSRYTVSRDSGRITMHELTPSTPVLFLSSVGNSLLTSYQGFAAAKPIYNNIEVVPFRFTPNMQRFIGPILTEGIVTTGMVAIGRALTDPEVRLSI